ncbi:hypothetical protein GCM10017566_49350 [Amycolatopsis bartoniae]|uniref:Uncharacterized protein n=1 Tax=Amycolatopsis bartoniae TaxID=941986 RepID=A0A8H9J134_9PSEU|nr:hypothetical protein GCM10017566_49350 [Amycolatopsis bartoniae]
MQNDVEPAAGEGGKPQSARARVPDHPAAGAAHPEGVDHLAHQVHTSDASERAHKLVWTGAARTWFPGGAAG